MRAEDPASLIGELRQQVERRATRLDGSTLVVQIPMHFQRRGGRKSIVAQDGLSPAIRHYSRLARNARSFAMNVPRCSRCPVCEASSTIST
jgi:hypothetical protein